MHLSESLQSESILHSGFSGTAGGNMGIQKLLITQYTNFYSFPLAKLFTII
jgi:hypothetical protein